VTASLEVRETADGATVRVRVSPGASRDRIAGRRGDALKVMVAAPPEKGRANEAVARVLAAALGARPADVAVVQGATSKDKVVRVRGWSAAALRAGLDALLDA